MHRISDLTTDFCFAVSGDCADLCNFVAVVDRTCHCDDRFNNFRSCHVDAALEVHWVHASSNGFHAFANDRLSQNCCCCCAVASFVIGTGSNFLNHLRAHVFELVFQFDFFGHGNTIFGDARCAEGFVQNHVTALWTKRDLNSVSQNVDAAKHLITGVCAEFYVFSSHFHVLLN